jgi:regulator of sirC expression with transglutaminase-like and TPR domain
MAELKKYCDDLRVKLDVAQSRLSEAERAAIKHEMRTQIYAEMYENLLSKFIDRKGAQE